VIDWGLGQQLLLLHWAQPSWQRSEQGREKRVLVLALA
jgi:hypothetical protein